MYKLYCGECENRFTITDGVFSRFLEDESFILTCPECKSIEVNLLEVEGQRAGY